MTRGANLTIREINKEEIITQHLPEGSSQIIKRGFEQ